MTSIGAARFAAPAVPTRVIRDERSRHRRQPYYFVPQPSYWPLVGSVALLLLGMGAAFWMNAVAAGPWMVAAGFCVLLVMLFGWFGAVIGESEARLLQQEGRRVVPLEHELVHLLRGDVLRGLLRRAVLHPQSVGARPRAASMSKLVWPDYTADWPTNGPYINEQFTPMGAIGIPLLNTIILLTSGFTLTVAHHALIGRPPRRAQALALRDHRAGLHVPGLPGVRIHPRLQRAQPQAVDGCLRLDVLHADGLPRRARDDRRDHAVGDARRALSRATSTGTTTSPSRPPAWYWHFVDVVWLLLFVLVYWL